MYGKYHKHSKEKSIAYKHNWLMFGRWEIMTLCKMCFILFLFLSGGCSELVVLGGHFYVSCVCTYCQLGHQLPFLKTVFSRRFVQQTALEDRNTVSLSQAKTQNSVQYKRSNFPKLRVLFCMQPIVCACITGPFSCWPVENLCQEWFNRQAKGCYTWKKKTGKDVSGKNNRIVHSVFVGAWDSWIAKCSLGKGTQGSRV